MNAEEQNAIKAQVVSKLTQIERKANEIAQVEFKLNILN